ncbi:hypothetical protein [Nocardia sp. CC216A]|nr:hypothetical protein [Nocardia sp. CC216A]
MIRYPGKPTDNDASIAISSVVRRATTPTAAVDIARTAGYRYHYS